MKKLLGLILVFWFSQSVQGQVSLAPTTVFTDENGIGTLYVSNGSEKYQEVNISFLFGYPGNDENGDFLMIYSDSIQEQKVGLGNRLRTFPRSFILAPGQQQTVRLQVRPDRSKANGTYFSRIKVSSNEQTSDITEPQDEEINTRINFKLEQVIAIFHKSGTVSTGLNFNSLEAKRLDNFLNIRTEFSVSGNSPFIGSLEIFLKSASGQILTSNQQTVALYFEGLRSYSIPLPEEITPGEYEVELLFKTERSDISSSDLVQAPPISKKLSITL